MAPRSVSVSIPVDELLGVAMAEAEGDAGGAAPELLAKAYAYAADNDTDGYIPRARLLSLVSKNARAAVRALEEVGSLRPQGKGWVLVRYLETNPSKAQKEREREAERQRKGRTSKGAAGEAPASPQDSTPDSGGDSTPDSTPETRPDSGPDSGVEGRAPSQTLPSLGENSPPGFSPGGSRVGEGFSPESTPEAHPETRPEAAPESPPASPQASGRASTPAPARKAAPPKPAPAAKGPEIPGLSVSRAALGAAYAAAISQATGKPCSPPTEKWNLTALEDVARTHGGGRTGPQLLGWLEGDVAAYLAACRELTAHQAKNFSPEMYRGWRNVRGLGAPAGARPGRTAAPQPRHTEIPSADAPPDVPWEVSPTVIDLSDSPRSAAQ
jgi:hypothetical protein